MVYLFFDTETTGLPKNWKAPVSHLDNWPRLVQLAYELYDDKGTRLIAGNRLIRPEDFIIPAKASSIHGISHERALREGESLECVLNDFSKYMTKNIFN